ncbi:MAG TPA: hypothetical protein VGP33_11875, partial [Chloroflexota bacterium]|nr:hypothetical protein [Chloroflexota bacterium]
RGDVPAPMPPSELLPDVLVPDVDRLPVVPAVAVDVLPVPAVPLPPLPKTAAPVSSRRLCGGSGTVSAATLPFAAAVELPDAVVGAHEPAVPAARVVLLTLPEPTLVLAVPEPTLVLAVPLPALVVGEPVALELLLPVLRAVVSEEPVLVLTVAAPVELAPLAELLAPAVPVDPWQEARPTDTTTAGTMVK